MGDGLEILFWLAVFVIIALRSASRTRSRTPPSRPEGAGADRPPSTPALERRGVLADLMRQIEAQVEAQRREAETRARAGEEVLETRLSAPAGRRPTAPERRSRRPPVPPDRRPPTPLPGGQGTYVVPGRLVQAPDRVSVARAPEAAALVRDSGTSALGEDRSEGEAGLETLPRRGASREGLGRLDRYEPRRRAILLGELLGPPPGLTGRTAVERRLEEIG